MPDNGLPDGWARTRLGELFHLKYGTSLPASARSGGGVPVVGSAGVVGAHSTASVKGPGIVVGRKGSIGDVTWMATDFWPIDTTYYVDPVNGKCDLRWAYQLLQTLNLSGLNRATGVPGLNRDDVHAIVRAAPGPAEQRRIAEVLDAIDAAIEKTEAVIAATERLRSALLGDLLTRGVPGWHTEWKQAPGIGTIPACWEVVRLGDVCGVRYGLGQPPAEKGGDPVPMIRATNIRRGRITTNELLFVGRNGIPTSRSAFLKAGEIVVVRSGAYTGDSALIPQQWAGAVAGYDLIVSPSSAIDPVLLSQYLLSPLVQRYFDMQRARSAQPHLNSRELSDTPVTLPPRNEQTVISGALLSTDRRIDTENGAVEQMGRAKAAAAAALLSGRLRVGGEI